MALFGRKPSVDHVWDELAEVGPTLGDAIQRFTRTLVPSPRVTTRASNLAAHFPRVRPSSRRPARLPGLRSAVLRSRTPKTAPNRRRVVRMRRPVAPPSRASGIDDHAGGIVGAIRDRLRALRASLLGLRRRLGGRS